MWEPYVFTRDGETFTVAPSGIRLVAADGSVKVDRVTPIPDDVAASTCLDLQLAGWEMVK